MSVHTYTLPNGLRIVHRPTASAVTYCGFALNVGTRDEETQQQGLAHCVEHLLFKGTSKRRAWHILNRMEAVGGDLNAYTNKEETIVYAAFLSEHLERAMELLADIVFHSTFPEGELEKEVGVILDEIQSYEDTPSELIFDDFEALMFGEHPLGRNILGAPAHLPLLTADDLRRFTQRFYTPANAVFFVYGAADAKRLLGWAHRYMGELPTGKGVEGRTPPTDYLPETRRMAKDTHQAHVLLGNRAYKATDKERTALYLLNNMLGGPGMNSRLNMALREKRGLVYNVESNLTSYTDAGLFSIYFGTDPKHLDTCLRLVQKELKRLCDQRLSTTQLAAAKKQLIGQIGVASDHTENQALGMAKTFLHYNRIDTAENLYARIEALTTDELWTVANEIFIPEKLSYLIYT